MEHKYYEVNSEDKKDLTEILKADLKRRADVIFAYLHGSFFSGNRFRDIDIAVYLKTPVSSPLQVELEIEEELGKIIHKYPIEVRTLNSAPLSFRYNVLRHGDPIFVLDDDIRCDFVEATLSNYFDFAPFRKIYLKEALGSGI